MARVNFILFGLLALEVLLVALLVPVEGVVHVVVVHDVGVVGLVHILLRLEAGRILDNLGDAAMHFGCVFVALEVAVWGSLLGWGSLHYYILACVSHRGALVRVYLREGCVFVGRVWGGLN